MIDLADLMINIIYCFSKRTINVDSKADHLDRLLNTALDNQERQQNQEMVFLICKRDFSALDSIATKHRASAMVTANFEGRILGKKPRSSLRQQARSFY